MFIVLAHVTISAFRILATLLSATWRLKDVNHIGSGVSPPMFPYHGGAGGAAVTGR